MRAKGIDAHLYMLKGTSPLRSLPELIDKELASAYPDWIHICDRFLYVPGKLREKIQNDYDILVASGEAGIGSAYNFKLPVICYILGSEGIWGRFFRTTKPSGSLSRSIKRSVRTYLCKKAIKKCEKIITGYDPIILSVHSIGQSPKQLFYGFPEDVIGNRQRVDKSLLKRLDDRYHKYDKVFLWLSRVNFTDRRNPAYKGTEKFLAAVEKLINNDHPNIKIIVGEHGLDWQLLKRQIEEKRLSSYFDYVPHLPYCELLTYLSIDNAIVFDELVDRCGELSGIAREAFCVGAVMVKSLNETLTSLSYGPDCPILDASTVGETYKRMRQVLSWNEAQVKQKKAEINKWAMAHLHWEKQIDRFINILKGVVYIKGLATRFKGIG
jgi:glycosyltransferase involved in cell wall biosynthesis